jgi:hypothetical protein
MTNITRPRSILMMGVASALASLARIVTNVLKRLLEPQPFKALI